MSEPDKKTRLLEIPDGNHAYLEEWKIRLTMIRSEAYLPTEPTLKDSERDPVPVAYYDED